MHTAKIEIIECGKWSFTRCQEQWKVINPSGPKEWSRSLTGGVLFLRVPTVRLWLGKFWCFGLAVVYERWSRTRGGHTWRFDCSHGILEDPCFSWVNIPAFNQLMDASQDNQQNLNKMTPLFLYWKKYAPSYLFKISCSPVLFNTWITEWYPKGFCDGFRYANVSLAHFALTEIGLSPPTRTHCPTWNRHSSLLPKGSWVVHSLTHPSKGTLGTLLLRSRSLRKHQHSLSISESCLGRVYALQVVWSSVKHWGDANFQ